MKSNLLLLLCASLLFSCSKQADLQGVENLNAERNAAELSQQTARPFKASTRTWYRISPTAPQPVVIDGTAYTAFAHVPGGGEGNATHMGKVKTWFTQLAFSASELPIPAGSLVAPVVEVLNYPVLGAPLPLIQAGDFTDFATANVALDVPVNVKGKIVSSVFYNDHGDAVFVSNLSVSFTTFVSATVSSFGGTALIVGGRGKFLNATGEVNYTGYFNPNNPNDAGYDIEGWISY